MSLMTSEPPPPVRHLAIDREDIAGERRRGNPPPQPPKVIGRGGHGGQVADSVQNAVTQTQATRTAQGIAADRLLVLELRSWDSSIREVLESRFHATVVDEQVESRATQRRLVQVPARQTVDTLNTAIATHLVQTDEAQEQLRIRSATKNDLETAKRADPTFRHTDASKLAVLERATWPASVEAALRAASVNQVATLPAKQQVSRVTVQFPAQQDVTSFQRELDRYRRGDESQGDIPPGVRARLFDALEWSGARTRADRTGPRLARERFPTTPTFELDVDLWHSGGQTTNEVITALRALCSRHRGEYIDELRTQSLVLARIKATRALAEALLDLDLVALVELPPVLSPAYAVVLDPTQALPTPPTPTGSEPRVGVIDSGTLSGHPLLQNWVLSEVDFSGEGSSDQQGHGTQVTGLVVYGDVHRCISTNAWTPRVLVASGKVLMRRDDGGTRFPDGHRPEKLVEAAIRHLHQHQQCRVFNLSAGDSAQVYSGGRQFAWAEVLDQLARELDIVIVVSAGNVEVPPLPDGSASGRDALQASVRDARLRESTTRICTPGTAGIAITVGALARSDAPHTSGTLAAAPVGAPAPFSRVGPGYEAKESQRSVKPDVVAYGGNFGLRTFAGGSLSWVPDLTANRRAGVDPHLGEPTTGLPGTTGRHLTSVLGTSLAAPHITHSAALALEAASTILDEPASANAVRALLGACTVLPPCPQEWLLDPEGDESWEKLRLVGYGAVDADLVEHSRRNSTLLLAEDVVAEDNWHVYSVKVPPAFLSGKGRRGIVVSLAYDPPVRSSRKDYLARTMWLEVLKGISGGQIAAFRGRQTPGATEQGPSLPQKNQLGLRPSKRDLVWSTLQVRRLEWQKAPQLTKVDGETEPTLHVLVGCQNRFAHGVEAEQWYGLAVRLWHEDATVDIHQELQSRIRPRATQRARIKQRG